MAGSPQGLRRGFARVRPRKTASGGLTQSHFLSRRGKPRPVRVSRGNRWGFAGDESYAENRLVSVTINAIGHRSEFGYDGLGRRVAIKELDLDANKTLQVTNDKKYLWDGVEIAEERDSTGANVTKHFFNQGFVDTDGTILFYTRDHLGSIRELTDNMQAVRARYDYDPYGRMTKVQGDRDSDFTFTGHFLHGQSGLNLTLYRAYNSSIGRWISRDPLWTAELDAGINLYEYCLNMPIKLVDPAGLSSCSPCDEYYDKYRPSAGGGVVCKGGKKYSCFWSGNMPNYDSNNPAHKRIADCVIVHEDSHQPDIKCDPTNPNVLL